jgi:hypothetical protein
MLDIRQRYGQRYEIGTGRRPRTWWRRWWLRKNLWPAIILWRYAVIIPKKLQRNYPFISMVSTNIPNTLHSRYTVKGSRTHQAPKIRLILILGHVYEPFPCVILNAHHLSWKFFNSFKRYYWKETQCCGNTIISLFVKYGKQDNISLKFLSWWQRIFLSRKYVST